MGRYLRLFLLRLAHLFVSLFILIFICLGLVQFFPGSPFVDEKKFDPIVVAQLESFYGLDKSFPEQFLIYVQNAIHGDLGQSMHYAGRSVRSLISEHGWYSLQIGGIAFLLAMTLSLLISVSMALKKKSIKSKFQLLTLLGLSIPSFVLGPFLIWFFAFYLDLLPAALIEQKSGYFLPILLLSFKPTLTLTRTLSAQLESVMLEKFIQTASAMGFSQYSIVCQWALKNALIAYLSQLSFIFAYLISGSLLVEIIFAIPGLGQQFVESILNRDWTLVMGLTLFYGAILMSAQFISDLAIAVIDPRVESL
jgi:oligopeptide transport system permease protein